MNRWRGVAEFIAVAESRSFSKAAQKHGSTASKISKAVGDLEKRLNTRLLHRTTRQLTLSPQGQTYYSFCKQALAKLDQGEEVMHAEQGHTEGELRVACVGASRSYFIVSIFAAFLKEYPNIQLEMIFADSLPNLLEEGIDFALVSGDVDKALYRTVRLTWLTYYLAASPEYIKKYGTPQSPQDLKKMPCVINSKHQDTWRLTDDSRTVNVPVHGSWHSPSVSICVDACLCGSGIFMLPDYAMDEYVRNGQLQRVLPDWFIRKPMTAAALHDSQLSLRVDLFLKFFANMVGSHQQVASSQFKELLGHNEEEEKILRGINQAVRREKLIPGGK